MLKKLIKHEFISSWKTMLPLYAAMLVAAGAGRLLSAFGGDQESSLMQTVVNFVKIMNDIVLLLGVFLTLYVIAMRVFKSMLGENGTMTMSIPATVRRQLTARFVCAMAWSALTAGFCVFAYWLYNAQLPPLVTVFFKSDFGFWYNFMAVVLMLLIGAMAVSGIYLSVALGHLFRKERVAATLLCGVGVFAVLGGAFYLALYFNPVEKIFSFVDGGVLQTLNDYGVFGAIFFLLLCIACFETANALLKKHLNILD